MPRKRSDTRGTDPTREEIPDRESITPVSASETAEYIAQMCTELRMLARSSADYIASMTCELATLASSAKLDRLSALLETVRTEAESEAHSAIPSL